MLLFCLKWCLIKKATQEIIGSSALNILRTEIIFMSQDRGNKEFSNDTKNIILNS